MFPHGVTVSVIRSGARNRDGDRVAESSHSVPGVAIAWSSGDGGIAGVAANANPKRLVQLYCSHDSDFREGDRVRIPGVSQLFRVVGYPEPWVYVFTGRPAGMVVSCEEVTASGQVDS